MSLRKKIAFTFIALLLFFTLAEGLARLALYLKRGTIVDYVITTDPLLNHSWTPNMRYRDKTSGVPFDLITNAQGWVETEDTSLEKPASTIRIFYVGDSNTQGLANPPEKMVERVEHALNSMPHRPHQKETRFEVINTGTASYSPLIYFLLIKDRIMPYSPDVIVINVDMTDLSNDSYYLSLTEFDDRGEPLSIATAVEELTKRFVMTPEGLKELSATQRWHKMLTQEVILFRIADTLATKYLPERKDEPPTPSVAPSPPVETKNVPYVDWTQPRWNARTEENIRFLENILSRTFRLLQEKGVHVILTGVPHYHQFSGKQSSRPHEVLSSIAKRHGVAFLNSYEGLRPIVEGSPQEKYYFAVDATHFSPEGNRIWAELQFKFLKKSLVKWYPNLEISP